jgi:alpha-L-rhamnosidase
VVQLSTIGKGSENFTLHVSNPDNTTAEVWVPSKENGTVTQNGKSINAIAGLKLTGYRNRYAVIEIGTGDYSFKLEF